MKTQSKITGARRPRAALAKTTKVVIRQLPTGVRGLTFLD